MNGQFFGGSRFVALQAVLEPCTTGAFAGGFAQCDQAALMVTFDAVDSKWFGEQPFLLRRSPSPKVRLEPCSEHAVYLVASSEDTRTHECTHVALPPNLPG